MLNYISKRERHFYKVALFSPSYILLNLQCNSVHKCIFYKTALADLGLV